MIFPEHFPCQFQIPVIFLQYFSHKTIQICYLNIKTPVTKICDCRPQMITFQHQNIMLIIFSMTYLSFPPCPFPEIIIIRLVQKSGKICVYVSLILKNTGNWQIIIIHTKRCGFQRKMWKSFRILSDREKSGRILQRNVSGIILVTVHSVHGNVAKIQFIPDCLWQWNFDLYVSGF